MTTSPAITQLALPLPLPVGRVNCWLIEDDPLTLVDTGPALDWSRATLEAGVAARGFKLQDLERIVLTHHHLDHVGAAAALKELSGAQVCAPKSVSGWLATYPEGFTRDSQWIAATLRVHGLSPDLAAVVLSLDQHVRGWADPVDVDRPLDEGDELHGSSTTWSVHLRPGHSASDMVLMDESSGTLIGGDHLLANISSNAVLRAPLDGGRERPKPLVEYVASLDATRAMPVARVLGGHGPIVESPHELIEHRVAERLRRQEHIRAHLDAELRTAFDIAFALWDNVAVEQSLLTMSEVIGHLDVLADDHAVAWETNDSGVEMVRAA